MVNSKSSITKAAPAVDLGRSEVKVDKADRSRAGVGPIRQIALRGAGWWHEIAASVAELAWTIRWLLASIFLGIDSVFGNHGWANARVESRHLAGHVGTVAPGRARRSRRLAFAHPASCSQPDLFSDHELRAAFGRRFGRRRVKPSEEAVIEAAKMVAHDGRSSLFKYDVLFLKKGDPAKHTYRAVVRFNPADAIVQAVAARHLVQCLDPDLLDCAWARRLRCDGIDRPRHNDAVARVRAFRLRHLGQVLYAAKLDVKALYDTIPHAAARTVLAGRKDP